MAREKSSSYTNLKPGTNMSVKRAVSVLKADNFRSPNDELNFAKYYNKFDPQKKSGHRKVQSSRPENFKENLYQDENRKPMSKMFAQHNKETLFTHPSKEE